MKKNILFCIVLLSIPYAIAADLTGCTNLTESANLTQNVTSSYPVCFAFISDNIELDCSGSVVNSTATAFLVANRANITLRNCEVYANLPLVIQSSNNSQIVNITTDSSNPILLAEQSTNNTLINNTFIKEGCCDPPIDIQNSTDNQFIGNILSTPVPALVSWIYNDQNNTFTNTTFNMTHGSITVAGPSTLTGNTSVRFIDLNVTNNRAYLNSSAFPSFNTTGIITLNNISWLNPIIQIDVNDSGTFVNCSSSECSRINYLNNQFVFNVTHFTTYQTVENDLNSCITINQSTIVSGPFVKCTIVADNLIVDCNGNNGTLFEVTLNEAVFNVTNRQNVTIRNCNVHTAFSGGYGLFVNQSTGFKSYNNSIFIINETRPGLFIESSNLSTITNTTLQSNFSDVAWIRTTGQNHQFTNLTLNTSNGKLIFNTFQLNNSNIHTENIQFSNNSLFVNTSEFPSLNTSAQIQFSNITFIDPKPQIDPEDDSSFIDCTDCTEVSYSGGVYVFNVSHFTTYRSVQSDSCNSNLTQNLTLTNDLSANDSCITITANDIVLDCTGHTINFDLNGGEGDGITLNGVTNTTIKNCIVNNSDPAGTAASFAVQILSSNHTQVINNTLISNNPGANAILMDGTSHNNSISNTILNAPDWLYAFGSSDNNLSNITLQNENGSIRFPGIIAFTNNAIVNIRAHVRNNKAFVGTELPELNTSAQITLHNITISNPRPVIDPEDDGTFVSCTDCTEISYNGSTYIFNVTHFTTYTIIEDSDGDGINDSSDTLIGNSSSINSTGVTNLNATVNGTTTNGTFNETLPVLISDGSEPIVNFSFNFGNSTLNLSKIKLRKGGNSIIVNISGQVSNKTIWISDNAFTGLCVKDEEIDNPDQITSGCTGSNETNLATCLGNSIGVTINNVTCVDEGNRIRISGLAHSGAVGTTSSGSGSTGGGGGGGGGGGFYKPKPNQTTIYNATAPFSDILPQPTPKTGETVKTESPLSKNEVAVSTPQVSIYEARSPLHQEQKIWPIIAGIALILAVVAAILVKFFKREPPAHHKRH